MPITIKENIATKGVPVPLGTAATELVPAAADAPAAARVREAGAVILAKTTMPDYGMLSSGRSSFHPLTRNPWNLAWNPGGSSAGAGAAAAAGYGPLHLGTDIGGSVRLPATLERHLHPETQPRPGAGRSAVLRPGDRPDDAQRGRFGLLLAELSKPDARDHMSLPAAAIDWSAGPLEPKGLKIGLHLDAGSGLPVDAEVKAAVEAAAKLFAKRAPISNRWRRSCRPRCCICRISSGGCGAGSISPPSATPGRRACCPSSPTGAAAAPTSRAPW